MNANATTSAARPADMQTRRLLVRMNATLFHCLGAAVLLESARVAAAERDTAGDPKADLLNEKRERAMWLREYAASIWPEFAWGAACADMRQPVPVRDSMASPSASSALCAEPVAVFYRAMSSIADDPALRSRLGAIAAIEECRRGCVESQPLCGAAVSLRGLRAAWAYATHRHAPVLRRAFGLLQQHWADVPPFSPTTYEEFLARAYVLFAPHLGLRWEQRLMVNLWLRPARRTRRTTGPTGRRVTDGALRVPPAVLSPACALPPVTMLR